MLMIKFYTRVFAVTHMADSHGGRCARLLRRSELLFQGCEAECLHHDAHIVQALDVHLPHESERRRRFL